MINFRKNGVILFLFLFLFSCAGTPKITPIHISAGTEQLNKGNAFYQKGCYRRALEFYMRAHELYTASDQPEGVAMSLNNIASVYRGMGEPAEANAFYVKAAQIYRRTGDRTGLSQVLTNRAAALIDSGNLMEAENLITEATRIGPETNSQSRIPLLTSRGILMIKKGRFHEAETILKEASAEADASASPAKMAATYFALGNLMMETKRYTEATENYHAALKADRVSGFYKGIADDLAALGSAARASGDASTAADFWERSLLIYSLLGLNREQDEVAGYLKTLPGRTSDAITDFFLNKWNKGKRLENPCEG
jgi:tetratricopeptide (TPR) repeat protein